MREKPQHHQSEGGRRSQLFVFHLAAGVGGVRGGEQGGGVDNSRKGVRRSSRSGTLTEAAVQLPRNVPKCL